MASDQGWFYKELGRRIYASRRAKGVSQEQIGLAAGLSRTSITNIEKGRQPVDVQALCRIARALQSEVYEFIPDLPVVPADLPAELKPQQREWVSRVLAIAHADDDVVVVETREAQPDVRTKIQHRKKESKRST